MTRFFICTDVPLIKGNAGFNYLLHLSEALAVNGQQVILIGIGNKIPNVEFRKNNINLININCKRGRKVKLGKYFDFFWLQFYLGKKCVSVLNDFKIAQDDYFVFYPMNISIVSDIMKKYTFIPQNHFSISVVEWMQPEDYKLGILDPAYWCFYYWFHFIVPKMNKILPISKKIDNYYTSKGKTTYLLRPLVNCEEYSYENLIQKTSDNRRKFIYTGGAENKDAISEMIKAIKQLPFDKLRYIELHLTGVTEKTIRKIMKESFFVYEELLNKKAIIHHDWMEYDDLIKLYGEMDFLLLARKSKISTEANYPSKLPEAMLCGVVPVCSIVGDYPYFLSKYNCSVMFEGYKSTDISKAILLALEIDNSKLEIMKKNAIKAARQYDIKKNSTGLITYLKGI